MKINSRNNIVLFLAFLIHNLSHANLVYNSAKKGFITSLIKASKPTHSLANLPPVVTASGNTTYCPLTSANIVNSISIIDPDDSATDAIYIQISSGYVMGEDQLFLNPVSLNQTITAEWDPIEGKLTLKSPIAGTKVTYTNFENAIKNVQFHNSSTTATGIRNFSISTRQANYLPRNGHYYEYVPNIGISWTAARDAAEVRTYFGLKGYLATLTAADEAQLAGAQISGAGWIGGSDAQTESLWKWVTGPEAGTVFWNGNYFNGSTPNFAFWNTGEPNQSGDEDYAHTTPLGVGIAGSWNDLKLNGELSGNYQAKGYIVEYGGTFTDPDIHLSASTTLTIAAGASITNTTPASSCDEGSLTLHATATAGTINWYDAAAAGNYLGTGTNYTTPNITETTTYYVEAATASCSSGRTAVEAKINITPEITNTNSPLTNCGPGLFILTATPSIGTINWYSQIGGTVVANGNTYNTPNVSANTTYYAEAINNGCTNGIKVPIELKVYSPPAVTDQTIEKCSSSTIALDASIPSMKYLWNTGETSQTVTTSTIGIYYVDISSPAPENCTSRKTITVTESNLLITTTIPASRCAAGSVMLQASATTNTINWYDAATGGNYLGTGSNFTTPPISATTIYYAEAATANCSSARTAVEAKINMPPTITSTNSPLTHCGPGLFTLTATPSDGTVNWYSQIEGTVISTGPSYIRPNISANTTYYAEAINNGCTNNEKIPIDLLIYSAPAVNNQTVEKCSSGSVTLNASIPNMKYLWSNGETTPTITVSTTSMYYVDVTSPAPENCTSRTTITVAESNLLITNTTPASRCDSGSVTLHAAATTETINWYAAAIGGNKIGTGPSFTTPNINATTTYYAEAATTNCSSARTAVEAKINIPPTITTTNSPLTNCGEGPFTLTATASAGTVNWYSQTGGTLIHRYKHDLLCRSCK
jgi:hypothetical protein